MEGGADGIGRHLLQELVPGVIPAGESCPARSPASRWLTRPWGRWRSKPSIVWASPGDWGQRNAVRKAIAGHLNRSISAGNVEDDQLVAIMRHHETWWQGWFVAGLGFTLVCFAQPSGSSSDTCASSVRKNWNRARLVGVGSS